MSLAFELTKIPGSDYLPRPEIMAKRDQRFSQDDGIWDVLGTYSPATGIITLDEENIKDWAEKLPYHDSDTYPVLRELVRLHEHAHAFMHTAVLFEGMPLNQQGWFQKLPPDVSESLTEYISLTVLEESSTAPKTWERLFHNVDKHAPAYYRRWKGARKLKRRVYYMAPVLKLARSRIWTDWGEFYQALGENGKEIKTKAALLKLVRT